MIGVAFSRGATLVLLLGAGLPLLSGCRKEVPGASAAGSGAVETRAAGTAREVLAAGKISRAEVAKFAQQVRRNDLAEFKPLSLEERVKFLKIVIGQLREEFPTEGPDEVLLTGLQGACPGPTREKWRNWIEGVRPEDIFWVF